MYLPFACNATCPHTMRPLTTITHHGSRPMTEPLFGKVSTFGHFNISATGLVKSVKLIGFLGVGRRPKLKSDEFSDFTKQVGEIFSLSCLKPPKQVLQLLAARPYGGSSVSTNVTRVGHFGNNIGARDAHQKKTFTCTMHQE